MRVKGEARRQAIVDQAAVVFRETGYERATMTQIAARLGGSKGTLYSYFASKQELFQSVMSDAMKAQSDALIALIDPATNEPRPALLAFGRAYLNLVLSAELIAVQRIGVSESNTNTIGPALYAAGPKRGWMMIAKHLQRWIDRGLIRPVPIAIVALHLRGLLEAGVVEPRLFGADPAFSIDEAVEAGVDAFLRAYGT